MFKKQFLLFIILLTLIFLAQPVLTAINIGTDDVDLAASKAGYEVGSTDQTTLAKTIGKIIYLALSLAGAIFLVLMIYAGYLWMTAHGEEEQVKKAQKIIMTSVIGLAVLVSAYSIVRFVLPVILANNISS